MLYILTSQTKRLYVSSHLIPQIQSIERHKSIVLKRLLFIDWSNISLSSKDSIYKCEEQLETYTCHLHSSIQISHIGELVIDLEVQALKTGVYHHETVQLLLACLPDRQTLERDSCNGRFGVGRQLPQVWKTQLWTSGIPLYWL